MANISYNGTIGSVDIGHEDLEVSSVPLQPTPLLYACSFDHRELSSDFLDNIHSTNFLAHHPRTPTFHSQDQLRLRLVPSPLEENSILNHQWQALPSYPDMGPVVANGQQVSENSFENPSGEGSSRLMAVREPPDHLRCTWPSCTAKEEDRVFIGKGAKTAHKRHMDGHMKPYVCPEVECPRHTRGFSRRDNYNNHLKTHRNKKKLRRSSASGHSSPLGVLGGGTSAGRRGLQRMTPRQRGRLVNVLLMCYELGFEVDEDEEDDAGSDDEETEEDCAD